MGKSKSDFPLHANVETFVFDADLPGRILNDIERHYTNPDCDSAIKFLRIYEDALKAMEHISSIQLGYAVMLNMAGRTGDAMHLCKGMSAAPDLLDFSIHTHDTEQKRTIEKWFRHLLRRAEKTLLIDYDAFYQKGFASIILTAQSPYAIKEITEYAHDKKDEENGEAVLDWARNVIEHARTIWPNEPKIVQPAIKLYKGEDRIAFLDSLCTSFPDDQYFPTQLATLLFNKEQFFQATSILEPLNNNHPDNVVIQTLLGQSYLKTKRNKDAQDILFSAHGRHPNDVGLVYYLAESHTQCEQPASALDLLAPYTCNLARDKHGFLTYAYGRALYANGQSQEAIQHLVKALAAYPDNKRIKEQIAICAAQTGQREIFDAVKKYVPRIELINYLDAKIAYLNNDPKAAKSLLRPYITDKNEMPLPNILALYLACMHDDDGAVLLGGIGMNTDQVNTTLKLRDEWRDNPLRIELPHLPFANSTRLFTEGYRAVNAQARRGITQKPQPKKLTRN